MNTMVKKFIVFIIILIMNYFSAIVILITDYGKVDKVVPIIIILIIHYLIYRLLLKKYKVNDIMIGILLFTLVNVALALFTYIKIGKYPSLSYNFLQVLNFTVNLVFRRISLMKFKLFTIMSPIVTFLIQTALFKIAYYFSIKKN